MSNKFIDFVLTRNTGAQVNYVVADVDGHIEVVRVVPSRESGRSRQFNLYEFPIRSDKQRSFTFFTNRSVKGVSRSGSQKGFSQVAL